MELSDIVLATSLLISLGALIVLAVQGPLQRRALREIADRSRVDVLTALDEIGTTGMRLEALERSVRRLTQRIDQLQLAQAPQHDTYDDALELLRRGASAEQLIADCGLTTGEATLLRRLHGRGGQTN